jgi:hypothetical protein
VYFFFSEAHLDVQVWRSDAQPRVLKNSSFFLLTAVIYFFALSFSFSLPFSLVFPLETLVFLFFGSLVLSHLTIYPGMSFFSLSLCGLF